MEAEPLSLPLEALGTQRAAAGAGAPAGASVPPPDGTGLLERAQSGESTAFCELVCRHQASVFSLALRLLGSREDAQELAQDVFVLLHRHLGRIGSAAHLGFWLRRTVCHRAIDRLRLSRVKLAPLDAAPAVEAALPESDPLLERCLLDAVARLPAVPRAVLLLRYQEDYQPMEIARALELPVNTVKSHLRRALALLRRRCAELHIAPEVRSHA